MAVAVQMDFEGATLDQYDEVTKLMGLSPGGAGPAGSISHFATKTSSGVRVVDVWQSREQFDAFAQEKIGPLSAQAGLGAPSNTEFFEVHNHFTPGA